jgi:hypothetical protein
MKNILLLLLAMTTVQVYGQWGDAKPEYDESNNKGGALLFNFNFGSHLPAADMAKRFGQDMSIGGGLEYITNNNFIFGVQGHYLFGTNVKEDPLALIRTPDGDIIGIDQGLANVALRERGFYLGTTFGKLLIFNEKKRSGLRVTGGLGYMQHKIRLQDNNNTVPLVSGEYEKGFDRLAAGLTANEFIGWQHMGANRRTNWYMGFDFVQGFTKTQRDWDFSSRQKLDGTRLDLRFGVRIGWILPFYKQPAEQIYY